MFETTLLFYILSFIWAIINTWWWVILPFVLWKPAKFLYLWWRNEGWLKKQRAVLLEIKMPKESLKPIRAMEQVLANMHAAVYHPPDWWEKYVDGQLQLSLSFEVASVGGETHFYIRTPMPYRDAVEASLYSQYPEAELVEVDDYVKYVPQNIPNKDWDMWGADYKMIRDDHYPFKTYTKFETEHEAKEEKRVDPVATLLEVMAKVKPGEQFWIQIMAEPIADANEIKFLGFAVVKNLLTPWIQKGKAIRDQLAKRPEKPLPGSIPGKATEILLTGKMAEEKVEERDIIPPEMKLTPGERDVVAAIEEKMSKPIFTTTTRFIYLGKRDVFFKPNFRLAFAYFNGYATLNLNALVPEGKTLTKIKKSWFLPKNLILKRRHYMRCRKLFRNYIRRFPPFFPRPGGTYHFNTEELASLFHFPSQTVAPALGVSRVEAKRGGAPPELPVG